MSEQTARNPRRGGGEPRDAAFWAPPVETLKVSGVPGGAANVDGRRVMGPLQGFGRLWRKTYSVRLAGVEPATVVGTWRERFAEFASFGKGFRAPPGGLVPGAVALLGGISGVMVLYSDEESFTYMTPEGHPFSGWITFSAYRGDDGCTVAQVQLYIRASDPLYEMMMPLGLHRFEDKTWRDTLRSLAANFGAAEEVRVEITRADPKRQWNRAGNIRHNALIHALIHKISRRPRPTGRRKA